MRAAGREPGPARSAAGRSPRSRATVNNARSASPAASGSDASRASDRSSSAIRPRSSSVSQRAWFLRGAQGQGQCISVVEPAGHGDRLVGRPLTLVDPVGPGREPLRQSGQYLDPPGAVPGRKQLERLLQDSDDRSEGA
jgi:hypothetical protein